MLTPENAWLLWPNYDRLKHNYVRHNKLIQNKVNRYVMAFVCESVS